jgi:hypothetical protein
MIYAKDRIASILLLCLAIGVFIASGNFRAESAAFPRMISIVMALASIMMFLRTLSFKKNLPPPVASDPNIDNTFFRNIPNFFISISVILAYLVTIRYLGYFTSTFIMIIAMVFLLGYRDYRMIAYSTAGFLIGVYVIFILIFNRPLPRGIFF